MSPVPASGRKVTTLLGIALVVTMSFLAVAGPVGAQEANQTPDDGAVEPTAETEPTATGDLGVPADAPTPAEGGITRVLTIGVIEEACPGGAPPPCWDAITLVANPGDVVVLHANLVNSAVPHNLHAVGIEPEAKTQTAGEALHTVSFVMPEAGEVEYICDVHPETMVGHVVTPQAALAAAGAHASVPQLGVHFLAYWVGVIAFAILFIVYGATFFLFKYNETPATTDHWDRSETPTESKKLAPYASLLAVVIAVAAIAAIIFVATR